jgi:hypothetical protein
LKIRFFHGSLSRQFSPLFLQQRKFHALDQTSACDPTRTFRNAKRRPDFIEVRPGISVRIAGWCPLSMAERRRRRRVWDDDEKRRIVARKTCLQREEKKKDSLFKTFLGA